MAASVRDVLCSPTVARMQAPGTRFAGQQTRVMDLVARAKGFLILHESADFCDDCLGRALGITAAEARTVVATLAESSANLPEARPRHARDPERDVRAQPSFAQPPRPDRLTPAAAALTSFPWLGRPRPNETPAVPIPPTRLIHWQSLCTSGRRNSFASVGAHAGGELRGASVSSGRSRLARRRRPRVPRAHENRLRVRGGPGQRRRLRPERPRGARSHPARRPPHRSRHGGRERLLADRACSRAAVGRRHPGDRGDGARRPRRSPALAEGRLSPACPQAGRSVGAVSSGGVAGAPRLEARPRRGMFRARRDRAASLERAPRAHDRLLRSARARSRPRETTTTQRRSTTIPATVTAAPIIASTGSRSPRKTMPSGTANSGAVDESTVATATPAYLTDAPYITELTAVNAASASS